jgi:acyl carrier protein
MKNKGKLVKIFAKSLGVNEEIITDELQYNSISEWDSVAHMFLIGEIEDAFDIMLDTDDIIDMSSPAKALEIVEKYL